MSREFDATLLAEIRELPDEDQQIIILALAVLCEQRPGWYWYLSSIAGKLGRAKMLHDFFEIHGFEVRAL